MSDENPKDSKTSPGESMAKAQPYIDAVWQFVGGLVVGALFGWWLDRHFHTSPWLLVVGMLLGFASGFISFMRVVQKLDAKNKKDRP